jgi:transposase
VPATHPLRRIKAVADQVLRDLSPTFTAMYSAIGRPSIPPERLLKSEVLIALYSVRSRRLFCERLDTDLLFRWFLDRSLDEPGFEHSTFSQNSERLLAHAVAQQFFDAVVTAARREGLLSDEHFTVDGTLIEAWASLKSVTPKEPAAPAAPLDDPGNPTVDFHGERRTNATHQSTTDPEARLARKGTGKEAKLCFSGHVLMENRHGLCVDLQIASATGTAERDTALAMLRRQARRGIRPTTLGADKGYHCRDFVRRLRRRGIRPHLACVRGRHTPGLDGRTTRHASYRLSQRLRKKVEEIFGWMKTIGGLRKSRVRGVARTQHVSYVGGAAYNLLRLSRLRPWGATE